jgi:ribosomal protein L3 glutamine methyltransferase
MPVPSIRDLVLQTAARFEAAGLYYGHGTDNALDEAVSLVFQVLGIPYGTPDKELERPVAPDKIERIQWLVQERIDTRRPVAYLVNEAWFAGLPFYVDERVLIPRSPIAELIESGFAPWIDPHRVRRILEIGTGSGCIAIACALAFPEALVEATDISTEALAVAAINTKRHNVSDRVRLLLGDAYTPIPLGRRYDIIVSNPPYVPVAEMQELPPEYAHEPHLALEAGADGLYVVARLLEDAPTYLSDSGILVIEVGGGQEALENRYPQVPFYWLEFERGGDGVFLLEANDLRQCLSTSHAQ